MGPGWARLCGPFEAEPLARRLSGPVLLFAVTNLIYFFAFAAASRPTVQALPIYVVCTILRVIKQQSGCMSVRWMSGRTAKRT
jgi:hypothetical protein